MGSTIPNGLSCGPCPHAKRTVQSPRFNTAIHAVEPFSCFVTRFAVFPFRRFVTRFPFRRILYYIYIYYIYYYNNIYNIYKS